MRIQGEVNEKAPRIQELSHFVWFGFSAHGLNLLSPHQDVFPGSEPHCWILRDALRLGCLALGLRGRVVPERDDI